jgi:hypothetical protein
MRRCVVAIAVLVIACKKQDAAPARDAGARPVDAAAPDAAPPDAPPRERPTVKKLAVGGHSTCAVMSDKTLRCWGANGDGQLGDGTQKDAAVPVTPKLAGVVDVALGDAHGCALLDDNSIACWGKIGFGKKPPTLEPAAVPGVGNAIHVFALTRGGAVGCATVKDDTMVCWGDVDAKGHPIAGATTEHRISTAVVGLDHVTALSANGALREDGGVFFIGGDGVPARTKLDKVAEIASIDTLVCARLSDGSVDCVGPSLRCPPPAVKQPAATKKPPAKPTKSTPKAKPKPAAKPKPGKGGKVAKAPAKPATKEPAKPPVDDAPALPIEVLKLAKAKHLAFDAGTCIVTTTGRVQCLDPLDGCKADPPWPEPTKIDVVSGHCALSAEGAVRCWSAKPRKVTTIAGAAGATVVASGAAHACALLGDGSVACWGKNDHGELGRGGADGELHADAVKVELK